MSGIGIELITSRLPEHAPAERVTAEDRPVEHVVDLVLGLVLVHRDLLEHDLALGVDLRVGRAEQHLRQEVEGLLGVGVEESRVEVRRLLAGGRVHGGAEAVEDLRDLDRRVALGALEEQVLEEMRDAGLRRRLVPRACANPETQGDRAHRGDRLGDDPDAGVELGYLGLVGGHVGLSDPGRRRARGDDRRRHARACARRHRDRRCHDGGSGGPGRRCRRRRAPPPTCPRRRGPG